jgi:hypothetical protein
MLRDVNRNPRHWVDASGRVRVIEGWHPSEPSRVGYNLLVDDDWLGTFASLDEAATAAAACPDLEGDEVALQPYPERGGRSGARARLRLVRPASDED